jgi:hypothetical protein
VLPPAKPLTLHANCCEAPPDPEIVAVKSCEPVVGTVAEEGASVSDIDGAKLTTAEALAVASATLTAVTVTLEPGVDAGALYSPPEEIVPVTVFPPVTPFTSHVTAELFVPVTIAVNRCEAPAERSAVGRNSDDHGAWFGDRLQAAATRTERNHNCDESRRKRRRLGARSATK